MGLVHNHPHTWPKPLQPLEHRAFRLLWLGTLASNAGSWMQRVATGWLVFTLTGSTTWLGIDTLAAGIPTVLLLPLGGALADRIDRRKLLIGANLVNAGLALALAAAWWTGSLQVWHIIGISFCTGVVGAVMVPANQSIVPAVAGEDHLPVAIALNSIQYNVARALGPALGGAALLWGGPGWCFAINAASFLILAVVLLAIREIPAHPAPRQPILNSIHEGWHFLRTRGDLRSMLLLVGLLALFSAPVVSMLPAFAKQVLQRDAAAYSTLLTAFGAGAALVGILLTLRPLSKNVRGWVFAMAISVGLSLVAMTLLPTMPAAALLTALAGMCFVGAMIELGTALLKNTPDEFRGRVSSVQQIIFRSAQPIGGLAAGLLAEKAGVTTAFQLCGAALVLSALTAGLWGKISDRASPASPAPQKE